jgi:phage/plasmid-like protein (TIGR03299 family)
MAHELEQFTDGSASMFSVREVPWHRLGVVVNEAPNAAEALKLARLDWNVTLQPVYAMTPDGMLEIENRRATVRPHPETGMSDVLGVVSPSYQTIQNAEAFRFCDDLVAESGATVGFETAGSLQQGRRVFMTMAVPHDVVVDGQGVADTTKLYLLVTTSHDGTESFRVAVTPVRVVCMNTLVAGLRRAQRTWSVRHTTSATSRIAEARESLRLTFAYADAFEAEAKALFERPVTDAQFQATVTKLFPVASDATDRQRNTAQQKRDAVVALWDAPTQLGIRNTAWGVYNTVAEWADWREQSRIKDAGRQMIDALEGRGAVLKQQALELAAAI